MKLALVVPGGVDRSGECRVIPALLALLRRLAAAHEVHVFALRQEPEPGEWRLRGALVHNVGAAAGRAGAVKAIVAEHRRSRFDVIQAIWSGAPGVVAVAAGRMLGVPVFVHVAGGELVALRDIGYGGVLGWRGRVRERLVLRLASAVSAASVPLLAAIAAYGVAANRIPLGVDLDEWPPRPPRVRAAGTPVRLLHVASINPVKDPALAIRTLAALVRDGVDARLDVAGEDTMAGAMQALCDRLGIAGRVQFHGFLTQRVLRPLVEDAHVHLVTSRHEAGPVAMLEAAVAGVPTVGTCVGHVAEWAPDAAVAVPGGDADALADAVRRLLEDEPRHLAIAQRAHDLAVAISADFTASQFESLYRRHARWS